MTRLRGECKQISFTMMLNLKCASKVNILQHSEVQRLAKTSKISSLYGSFRVGSRRQMRLILESYCVTSEFKLCTKQMDGMHDRTKLLLILYHLYIYET